MDDPCSDSLVGLIYAFGLHPVILGNGNYHYSADLSGVVRRAVSSDVLVDVRPTAAGMLAGLSGSDRRSDVEARLAEAAPLADTQPASARGGRMIMDGHVHLHFDHGVEEDLSQLVYELDLFGIDRSCLMPGLWRKNRYSSCDDLLEVGRTTHPSPPTRP